MISIGSGVWEIRVRDETGAFRVIYVASLSVVIYAPDACQKKTEQTVERDLDLATIRLRQIVRGRTR